LASLQYKRERNRKKSLNLMSDDWVDRIAGREIVPGKPNWVRVVFASGSFTDIPIALWVQYGLKIEADIASEVLALLTAAKQVAEAKERALKYLDYKPRTEHEVRMHLLRMKHATEIVEQAIHELISAHYIDDLLYARMYADSKLALLSHKEFEWKLRQRGISRDVIRRALAVDEDHSTEAEAVIAVANKYWHRYGTVPEQKRKVKLAAHLQRKGYPIDMINQVIENLISCDMENEYS
jgi:regulatory protein